MQMIRRLPVLGAKEINERGNAGYDVLYAYYLGKPKKTRREGVWSEAKREDEKEEDDEDGSTGAKEGLQRCIDEDVYCNTGSPSATHNNRGEVEGRARGEGGGSQGEVEEREEEGERRVL